MQEAPGLFLKPDTMLTFNIVLKGCYDNDMMILINFWSSPQLSCFPCGKRIFQTIEKEK